MGISYQVPTEARYIPTSTIFSAAFNGNPANPGKYDFNLNAVGPINQNVVVDEMQPNTIYLIERMSAGGNITESQFLEAIDVFCFVDIKKSLGKQRCHPKPIPIANYFDGQETATWIYSDKGGERLTLSFQGVLNQLPSMVGIATVKVQISLNLYAIESAYFVGAFRNVQGRTIGQINRR